jgi:hypothetical protein
VSLLARVVPEVSDESITHLPLTADSLPTRSDFPCKTILFNETRLGHTKDQEDVVVAADEERDMLRAVSDHRRLLPIAN